MHRSATADNAVRRALNAARAFPDDAYRQANARAAQRYADRCAALSPEEQQVRFMWIMAARLAARRAEGGLEAHEDLMEYRIVGQDE